MIWWLCYGVAREEEKREIQEKRTMLLLFTQLSPLFNLDIHNIEIESTRSEWKSDTQRGGEKTQANLKVQVAKSDQRHFVSLRAEPLQSSWVFGSSTMCALIVLYVCMCLVIYCTIYAEWKSFHVISLLINLSNNR